MRQVRFDNLTEGEWRLAIEPWALLYIVPPDAAVIFEYEDPEDFQVEFAVQKNGLATIGVHATTLKITVGDKTVFETLRLQGVSVC